MVYHIRDPFFLRPLVDDFYVSKKQLEEQLAIERETNRQQQETLRLQQDTLRAQLASLQTAQAPSTPQPIGSVLDSSLLQQLVF